MIVVFVAMRGVAEASVLLSADDQIVAILAPRDPTLCAQHLTKVPVGSTGERNGPGQCSSRGIVSEGLARSGVELQRDQVEVLLAVHGEVGVPG